MSASCRLLLVSGSLRKGSTNSAVLRTALRVAPQRVTGSLYEGTDALPAFNPDFDTDPLPPPVVDLRDQIWAADALLFSTPEYAGALPGSFKNLLDWTVGDEHPGSMNTKPAAWVNVSARGATNAHDSLCTVLQYVGAQVVDSACLTVPVTNAMVRDDGFVADPALLVRLSDALAHLADACGS